MLNVQADTLNNSPIRPTLAKYAQHSSHTPNTHYKLADSWQPKSHFHKICMLNYNVSSSTVMGVALNNNNLREDWNSRYMIL